MSVRLAVIGGILTAALAAGTWRDRRPAIPLVVLNGYQVLAVDFHVHTHPLSSATLAPWDVVTEAQRARLDAIAVTPHDHVFAAKVARWFSSLVDGPIVLVGEEISASQCHLLAVGIDHTIEWGRRASRTIGDIRRQGGLAIAAHPLPGRWPGCDEAAARLDGSEVVHPIMFGRDENAAALRAFNARGAMAAIGGTDFHIGQFGMARTYVFARERSAEAIVEAVRARRTVVYDGHRAYGDPALVQLAAEDGRLPRMAADAAPRRLATVDGAVAIVGLIAAILAGFTEPTRPEF
jgi:predicted metal-dependent phosphoesterase TrpH